MNGMNRTKGFLTILSILAIALLVMSAVPAALADSGNGDGGHGSDGGNGLQLGANNLNVGLGAGGDGSGDSLGVNAELEGNGTEFQANVTGNATIEDDGPGYNGSNNGTGNGTLTQFQERLREREQQLQQHLQQRQEQVQQQLQEREQQFQQQLQEREQQFQQQYEQATERYQNARQLYLDSRLRIQQYRQEFVQCRDSNSTACVQARLQVQANAQPFLSNSADLVLQALDRVKTSIEASTDLTAQQKSDLLSQIDAHVAEMTAAQGVAANLSVNATPDEIKAAATAVRQAWTDTQFTLKKSVGVLVDVRLSAIIQRTQQLSTRLHAARDALAVEGKDVSQIDATLADFDAKVTAANTEWRASVDAYVSATNTTIDQVTKDAQTHVKNAQQDLKDAEQDLRTLVQEIKDANGGTLSILGNVNGTENGGTNATTNVTVDEGTNVTVNETNGTDVNATTDANATGNASS